MIEEGDRAPGFELPAVSGSRLGWVTLEEFLGESAVVLAFYPADFNPSCTDETTDLDEFEVFRMQSDATVLAISGDSLYSHRAFANAYDLHLPLLADVDASVAEAYGVATDDGRYATRRAVFILDHQGTVIYRWAGDDIEDRPDIDAVQSAFRGIEDADLAAAQYRQACERYDAARDTFVEGMRAYERHEWVLARSEFDAATDELSTATDAFDTAARFSADEDIRASFERGERVAAELDRTIGLMADSARAYASGERRRAEQLRREGEEKLERLRDLGAPPDPDAVPVDIETLEPGETVDVSLDFDLDADTSETGPADAADETGLTATTGEGEVTAPGDRAGRTDERADTDGAVAEDERADAGGAVAEDERADAGGAVAEDERADAGGAVAEDERTDTDGTVERADVAGTGEAATPEDGEDIDEAALDALTAEIEEQDAEDGDETDEQATDDTGDESSADAGRGEER